jgi:ribosome maturation factor RimP
MSTAGNRPEDVIVEIWELIEPVIEAEGMSLVDVEYRREAQGWVLRLYIDQEGGVAVDDCARVSHVVGDLLDVSDLIPVAYHLEVSSPGLNRPLRKLSHFREQVGNIIEVKTSVPLQNRRKFKGVLKDIDTEKLIMDCDGQIHEIALEVVEKAKLRYFETLKNQE